MDKKQKAQSYVPQALKPLPTQSIDTTADQRNSFGERFQSFKQNVFQPDTTDLSVLPEKLKKSRDKMMDRKIELNERLAQVAKILKDCKFVGKQGEFKLNQDKFKPDILINMDSSVLKLFIRFVYDIYQEHIEPYDDAEERFGYPDIFGHLPIAIRPECFTQFYYCIASVYSKLICEHKVNLLIEDGQQQKDTTHRNSGDQLVEQIKLITFIMINMTTKSESAKKEVIEAALHFTEVSITALCQKFDKKNIDSDISEFNDLLRNNQEARPGFETLFTCYLAQCASVLYLLDQESVLQSVCRIIQLSFRLIDKFSSVFNSKIYDISSTDFPLGFIFKDRLLDVNTGVCYTRTTLLNVLLQITKVICSKLKSRVNRGLMTPELQKLQDILDQELLRGLDRIIIRQIRVYQHTERFVKVGSKKPVQSQNQPFEVIKEVEESFLSGDSDQSDQNIIQTSTFPQPIYEELKEGMPSVFNSSKIIQDQKINSKTVGQQHSVPLVYDIDEQLNWMRVNICVIDISNDLIPNHYLRRENDLPTDQKMASSKSLISHLCDLVRVQLFFIVRFQFEKSLKRNFPKPLIEIPSFIDQDCFLIQTLVKLFYFVDYQGHNHEFKAVMLRQIYLTLDLIADGCFDAADRFHYLKLMYLLFMNNKLEPLSEPIAVFGNEIPRAFSFVNALYKLVKIEFYSEKYVRLFEETFDLNNVQDILQLQDIIREFEQKRSDENNQNQNASDDAVILLNKVLVQTQAINQIVQTSIKSDIICSIAIDQLISEIHTNGMKNCDPQGAIYVERSQHITLANGQYQISTLEYKLSQSRPFSSHLYICFKLALGLLDPRTTAFGKAYDILNYSENHHERQHQSQSYSMLKNSFGLRNSSQSSFLPNSVQYGFNQCDDCLRLNFKEFALETKVKPFQLTSLFSFLLRRIQELSKSLDDHEQTLNSQLGQGQLKQMSNMSAEQIRAHLNKVKLGQSQSKVITKKTLIANQSSGFKIVEKVNGIMSRFVLYCSQNLDLGNSIVATITNTERSELPKFPTLLDSLKLKSLQVGQYQPMNLRDIPNLEFKCLLLRNIVFLIDSKRYDTVTYMLELMKDTLKQVKLDQEKFKEHTADFKRMMTQLDPFHKQKSAQEVGYVRSSRERSASNIFFSEYDSLLQKMRTSFRKLAEIQITTLSLYTKVVRKNHFSLEIFERKLFLEQVLMQIQRFVVAEGSYINELIQEGLSIFLFSRSEPCDPFGVKAQTSLLQNPLIQQVTQNQLVTVYERMFEFVLTTLLDFIRVVFSEDSESQPNIESQKAVLQSVKCVLETLNNKIMVREGNAVRDSITSDLIKVSRSIRASEIQQLKKIFIFLREQQTTQSVDIQYIIKQMSTLLIRLFGVIPKAIHMKEFFSFLREIFYHNQIMDDVDVNLAEDVLKILNHSIHFKNKIQIFNFGQAPRNEMIDHFVFGKIAPGTLIMNDFDLSRDPQICLLFRISHEQIAQESSIHKKNVIRSVLFSIQQRQPDNGNFNMEKVGFDLEIIVDAEKGTFQLQDPPLQVTNLQQTPIGTQQIKPKNLENRWHLLIVKFKHKSGGFLSNNDTYNLEVYIDKLDHGSRVVYQLPRFDPRQKYLIALGNSVDFCKSSTESKTPNLYFRGRCSLPLFFTGLPDTKSSDHGAETWRAIRESLTEFLNTKDMINKKQLDLNQWIQKYQPDGAVQKPQKKYIISEFQTLDSFTQPVIQLHQVLNRQGYLCAAHCRRASEVFVGLGGFKNMYPLIDKVIKSNLLEIGIGKPAAILCQVFRILSSLLDQEPVHIEVHFRKRNLINLLRYCILRLGKYQMITNELLIDIKNIVKKNILSQVAFTVQNEKYYLIQNAPADIRIHKKFYSDFLSDFTHAILLDKSVAVLSCQIISKAQPDVSSTTHSSISGGPKQTLVFTELLDLIHNICAPEPLQNQSPNSKVYKQTGGNSKSSENDKNQESASSQLDSSAIAGSAHQVQVFCDGQILQQSIVEAKTIELLLVLVNNSEITHQLSFQQLQLLGQCISASIIYLDDQKSFTTILQKVTFEHTGMSKIQLLIYLQIVLQVIKEDLKKKEHLYSVYTSKDQFKIEVIAQILFQFDPNPRERITEEIRSLSDKIIAMALLILNKEYLNKKLQIRQNKQQNEKVAAFDPDKKGLLNLITKYLSANTSITTETYLTLMQLAFNKRNCTERPPMLDEIDSAIKESRLRLEGKSCSEVIDFDIDFYFIVLENFKKLTSQTKVVFLNQMMLFLKNKEEGFMQLLVGQVSSDTTNPFLKKIKLFYHQVVTLCLESKEEVMLQNCQRVLVEICAGHFTRSLDEAPENYLVFNDETSLTLFRRIFSFFGQELKLQFQLLQKVLKQILIDVNWRKQPYQDFEQLKLNLKLLQLLQFVEEVYIKNKSELAEIPAFHQSLVLLMFLLEQLGLISMDLPDRVADEYEGRRVNSSQTQDRKPQQQKVDHDANYSQLKFKVFQDINPIKNSDETLNTSMQQSVQRSPTVGKRTVQQPQKIEFQVVNGPQQKHSENFISGGPVRSFMHILTSCMHDVRTPLESFQIVLDLLRFLTLREKTPLIIGQIQQALSEEFEVSSILIQNLFNQNTFTPKASSRKPGAVQNQIEESKESTFVSRGQSLTPEQVLGVISFQKQEIDIIMRTIDGIQQTTQMHHNEEARADPRQERTNLPSYADLELAEQSRARLRKRKPWGFTTIDGFVCLQMIAETIQIIDKILSEENSTEKSDDTADFNLKVQNQKAFVGNAMFSTKSVVDDEEDTNKLTPQQIKAKLSNQNKLTKITQLCLFLFDCLNEQITGGMSFSSLEFLNHISPSQFKNQVDDHLINRVTRFLVEQSTLEVSEILQRINLFCTFLDRQDEDLLIMDGSSETVYDSAKHYSEIPERSDSTSNKQQLQQQQEAVLVLNTMGFVDQTMLNRQMQQQMQKKEFLSNKEADFQTPERKGENLDEETIKLVSGEIRMSQLQVTYFGEKKEEGQLSRDPDDSDVGQPLELKKNVSEKQPSIKQLDLQFQEFDLPPQTNDEINQTVTETERSNENVDEDTRQSWVKSVSNQVPSYSTKGVSSQKRTEEQNKIRNEYKIQVFDFIHKLFLTLSQLFLEREETNQIDLVEKIVSQTLFNQKQRKISLSFAAVTSHKFSPELNQARVNSNEIFRIIKTEITKIQLELAAEKPEPEKRRNAQLSLGQLMNPMMQSQNFKVGNQFGDFQESTSFTPQKTKESFNHIGTSQSANFRGGYFSQMNSSRQNFNPMGQTVQITPAMEFDIPFSSSFDEKSTLDYIYTRNMFKKTVKRLQEDESSLWYDKVEEQLAEFTEIKKIYEQMQTRLEPTQLTAESVWRQKTEEIDLKDKPTEMVKFLDQWLKNIENQSLIQNPASRNYFIAQRRNIDSWGRMMLLKPNRKALDYEAWVFYDYFVHDFLNKAFAVSLLNDEDFPDMVKPPQIQKSINRITNSNELQRSNQKLRARNRQDSILSNPQSVADGTQNHQSDDSDYQGDQPGEYSQDSQELNQLGDEQGSPFQEAQDSAIPYSDELQKVRIDIMQRMERNKLLQRVLTDRQPLKRVLKENPVLVEKVQQKINRIIKNEQDNRILSNTSVKFHYDAQNIKVKGTTWGKVIITADYFVYISYCRAMPEEKANALKYVNQTSNLLIKQELILKWENVEEIMRRKVLNLFQGIDLITQDKKCYTFNLTQMQNCDDFFKNLNRLVKERAEKGEDLPLRLIENPVYYFQKVEQYQNEWKNGQRTNMEFLLLINKYSGRSFNDLSQYPMFPWVLKDYDSNVYEFDQLMKSEKCYRDFTKHTGVMGEEKINSIEEKYKEQEEIVNKSTGEKNGPEPIEQMSYGEDNFQMRMGFSTAMNTTMLLSRIEPYTTASYFCQDQGRDQRVPISFELSWENVMNQPQSNTELIPEHFYLPECLLNLNHVHLGWQQDQKEGRTGYYYQIDQMFIPQWATNHYDFVRIMRENLESSYVTENLGHWIDLVFGVHQKNEQKMNKFFGFAYEEWHQKPENRAKITNMQIKSLIDYYQAPSKLFDQSIVSVNDSVTSAAQSMHMNIDTTEAKTNFNPNFKLIKAFLEYKTNGRNLRSTNNSRQRLRLGQISVHNNLEQNTNIVHMLFNNEKRCLVFVRQEDTNDKRAEVGNLVVYVCAETLTKENFKEKFFDLQMRYEWVADELHNVFQVYFSQDSKGGNQSMKLFACGYMDNSLRIFDLDNKAGPPKIIHDHNARITCLKFSANYKFLYTCDEDGVILHYGRKKLLPKDQKDQFPFTPLHKIQDQMEEILAIDTNQTLDLYVTLSRDGTIAVRCQRTSKLWVLFKMFSKRQNQRKEDVIITGFAKAFSRIDAIRLSLHGYIVLVGSSAAPKNNQSKYLVYNLNGDTLLAQMEEKCTIKNVFLNSTEDLMVLAQNCSLSQDMSQQGNIRVLKLFGLEKIANLTKLCYEESLKEIKQQKAMNKADQNNDTSFGGSKQQIKTPMIGAIALKKGEVSLNIFFVEPSKQTKEIICFESSKSTVWSQLEDMALAPKQRLD